MLQGNLDGSQVAQEALEARVTTLQAQLKQREDEVWELSGRICAKDDMAASDSSRHAQEIAALVLEAWEAMADLNINPNSAFNGRHGRPRMPEGPHSERIKRSRRDWRPLTVNWKSWRREPKRNGRPRSEAENGHGKKRRSGVRLLLVLEVVVSSHGLLLETR